MLLFICLAVSLAVHLSIIMTAQSITWATIVMKTFEKEKLSQLKMHFQGLVKNEFNRKSQNLLIK